MSKRFTGFLVLLMIAALVGTLSAQVIKGSISGTVTDPQGAVITGATVKATNVDNSALTYTTTTDNGGAFHFNLIPAGTYKVEISHGKDYRPAVRDNVLVSAGADTGLGNVKMILGSAETTVEVKAEAAPLVTNEAQITNTFSGTPLTTFAGTQENQGLDNMALQIPGVTAIRTDSQFSNSNGVSFSVNGLRGRNNDQQIDGQNNNDNSVAGPATILTNPEFVGQYVAITNEFGAEYGRNSGSVINIITKSGTNSWHGSVYGTENNSILNSMDTELKRFTTTTKLPRVNDEFSGFTLGGPWIKNKVFFFGGFDNELISGQTNYHTGLLAPTPAGAATLAACFPGSASMNAYALFGPYGVSGGNPTPTDVALVDEPGCNGVEEGGVSRTVSTPVHQFDWLLKNDLVFANDNISVRYLFSRLNFFNTNAFGTAIAAAGYPNNVPALSQSFSASWTHNLGTHMVNEARIGYSRLNVMFGGNSLGNTVPGDNNAADALTNVNFSDTTLLGFGPATTAPQGRIVNTWQAQDNWNYIWGKHTIKAGVNWTYQRSPNIFLPTLNGSFRFGSWGEFAANTPNRVRVANGPTGQDFREYDTFLYAGDTWKLASNLNLTYGITWTYFGQPENVLHDVTTKRETGPTPFWNPALPLDIRTMPEIPTDYGLWGPSAGFAYTPQWGGFVTGHGKTVIRGGVRLTVDPPYYNIYLNEATAAPVVFLQTVSAPGTHPLPAVPTGPNVRASLASSLTLGVFDPRTFAETRVAPDFTADKTLQWNFGFQRQFGNNMAFEARYVGNHGYDLFQSINANPFIRDLATNFPQFTTGLTPCAASQEVTPPGNKNNLGHVDCSQSGNLRERTNTAYSYYNGLQLEFRANNLFKQLTMRTAYTWSKTLDNSSEIFGTAAGGNTTAFSPNPLDFKNGEYSFSGLDIPHNWSIAFNEDLPFFRDQKGAIGHIFGGWSLSGSYILGAGERYTPSQAIFSTFDSAFFGAPNYQDNTFMGNFFGLDSTRPFAGNASAPINSVGMFAGDACNWFQLFGMPGTDPICSLSPTTLLSYNQLNQDVSTGTSCTAAAGCAFTVVTNNDVRYIVNMQTAQGVFGAPFGNVRRNTLQEAITNYGNFSIFKKVKITERVAFTFHTTLLNAFNHPNYVGIDPYIEDAGAVNPDGTAIDQTGFADPTLYPGGSGPFGTGSGPQRRIIFGGKLTF